MGPVLVLVDRDGGSGAVHASAPRLLTLARRLGEPVAVLPHPAGAAEVRRLARYGAERVCVVEAPETPDADPVALAVAAAGELAWQMGASVVLTASTRTGREAAARVAVRLGAGIVTAASDVRPGPDGPVTVQEVCGGAYRVESVVRGQAAVIAVDTGSVPADAAADPVPGQVEESAVERLFVRLPEAARRARVVARTRKPACRPAVSCASVVVAGGRGVGSAAGFGLIEQVADALGAAVGGTHGAADLGWCPHDALIGQTGAVVHPKLYVACGISGSVHHRAGMQHASTIVAIDKDPSAPIFRIADVGIVGDLHQVLPALLNELARRRADMQADAAPAGTPDPTGESTPDTAPVAAD
ncbi:electron transfer flavoprotein subunit alpha/FixB family protein [Yinghuangia seranimata]|uniref:electron transfer flavoprotein subunit alpha/FixB family protein n=1 Tax=Yinghuangia seranimata TaxID=408067 RepID=UPI00248C8F99|nr:electron transfer flavoprotein subunit alpha/FixB family protein [Yinghuangia seranimata]MDI2130916.1 electron transfer flavoprotein subunit alpha/FixB family protein [Yinghuangia seranimata]